MASSTDSWTKGESTPALLEETIGDNLARTVASHAGENIAYGYETPAELVRAWMHSAGHRANILSRQFHRIGVSGWRATNGTTYATQDFVG